MQDSGYRLQAGIGIGDAIDSLHPIRQLQGQPLINTGPCNLYVETCKLCPDRNCDAGNPMVVFFSFVDACYSS
jgi:hypothetical protein